MTQVWILVCMITLPGLLSVAVVDFVYRRKNRLMAKRDAKGIKLQTFKIYPEEGLASQGLLWLTITVPISYFLTFGVAAWLDYSVQISADGFEKFVKISALPLGLLSLTVPLSLLIMRIHSTTQTATQIKITKHKNNLDTYYAHRKAMFEYFATINEISYEGNILGKFDLHPRLHLRFFKKSPPDKGVPNVNTHQIKKLLILLQRSRIHLQALLSKKTLETDRQAQYLAACISIYKIADLLSLEEIYKTLKTASFEVEIVEKGKSIDPHNPAYIYTAGKTQDELFGAFRYCRSYARLICEFCGYSTKSFSQTEYADIDRGDTKNYNKYQSIDYIVNVFSNPSLRKIEKEKLASLRPLPTRTSALNKDTKLSS